MARRFDADAFHRERCLHGSNLNCCSVFKLLQRVGNPCGLKALIYSFHSNAHQNANTAAAKLDPLQDVLYMKSPLDDSVSV